MVKLKVKRKNILPSEISHHFKNQAVQYIQRICYGWADNLNLINYTEDEVQASSSYKLQWASGSSSGDT